MKKLRGMGLLLVGAICFLPNAAWAVGGIPLWTNQDRGFKSVEAMAVDTNGNIFVTGNAWFGQDYYSSDLIVIKYSAAGVGLWTNRYDGPNNSYDSGRNLAIDPAGNVIVSGWSPNPVHVDAQTDYLIIKYSSAGQALWTNRYDGGNNVRDFAVGVAVDGAGNVFVTGYSARNLTNPLNDDFVTIKYSSSGQPLWTNRYDGNISHNDQPVGIAVDQNGDVYVTGYSTVTNVPPLLRDFITVKYSNAGEALWTNRYDGPVKRSDTPAAIAVASDTVFVTGSSPGTMDESNVEFATLAYSSAGTPLWTNRYRGNLGSGDVPVGLALDASSNVVVAGIGAANLSYSEYATVKYSAAGVPLWTNRYAEGFATYHQPVAVTADPRGNVFVTGRSSTAETFYDYATVGYSSAGVPLWTNRFNATGNYDEQPIGVGADSEGNVIVSGDSLGGITIKYSSAYPVAIPLVIENWNNQAVLSWSNAAFGLQSAASVSGAFTNVPGATSPYTNPISGPQRFFRLQAN